LSWPQGLPTRTFVLLKIQYSTTQCQIEDAIFLQARRVFTFSAYIVCFHEPHEHKNPKNKKKTSTMKYSLLLLAAAMVGVVCGAQLGAEIQGVTEGSYCTEKVDQLLYNECVEDVAVSMGVVLSRRLELRGNRELNPCSGCGSGTYPRGHWCFVMCSRRRLLTVSTEDQALTTELIVTEDQALTKNVLDKTEQIQNAANDCLGRKIKEGCKCLGNPEDLTIKIMLSE
jgi:hypothetical protein